MDKHSYILSIL